MTMSDRARDRERERDDGKKRKIKRKIDYMYAHRKLMTLQQFTEVNHVLIIFISTIYSLLMLYNNRN